jgi:uncharacterized linocin/CFP29 family protein
MSNAASAADEEEAPQVIIIYQPEDGDEQRWDLDGIKATFAEGRAAEKAGNFKWVQLQEELAEGNIDALQAAVWVLRKRTEPTLKFSELDDLPIGSVDVEFAPVEKAAMRAQLENDPTMSEEARQMALQMLGAGDAPEPSDEDDADPKDAKE